MQRSVRHAPGQGRRGEVCAGARAGKRLGLLRTCGRIDKRLLRLQQARGRGDGAAQQQRRQGRGAEALAGDHPGAGRGRRGEACSSSQPQAAAAVGGFGAPPPARAGACAAAAQASAPWAGPATHKWRSEAWAVARGGGGAGRRLLGLAGLLGKRAALDAGTNASVGRLLWVQAASDFESQPVGHAALACCARETRAGLCKSHK